MAKKLMDYRYFFENVTPFLGEGIKRPVLSKKVFATLTRYY